MKETLQTYLLRNSNAELLLNKKVQIGKTKLNEELKIYFLEEVSHFDFSITSYFHLFKNDEFVGNPIILKFSLSRDLLLNIANLMLEEYFSCCDFSDIENEDKGIVPCSKYKGIFEKCEDCPDYSYGKGKDSQDACLGCMYHMPSHLNGWKLRNDLEKKYGIGTENYKRYLNDYKNRLDFAIKSFEYLNEQ